MTEDARRRVALALGIVLAAAIAIGYVVTHSSAPGPQAAIRRTPTNNSGSSPSASLPSLEPQSTQTYVQRVMEDHPVAFWPLSDKGSTAEDMTGNYPGVYVGSPGRASVLSSALGAGISLDGVDDYVTSNSLTTVQAWQGYTMEAWVRLTQESDEEHIVAFNTSTGANGPAILHDQPTKKFKFRDCEGDACAQVLSQAVPQLGLLYHLVVSVDANDQGAFYVNGELQERFVSSRGPPFDGLFAVGAEYDTGATVSSFFHGVMGDVAIYAHSLDAVTVRAHYQAGR